jgi:hypothetical protein
MSVLWVSFNLYIAVSVCCPAIDIYCRRVCIRRASTQERNCIASSGYITITRSLGGVEGCIGIGPRRAIPGPTHYIGINVINNFSH